MQQDSLYSTGYCTRLLGSFFTDVRVSSVKIMSAGKENTSILLEGNFGKVILRVWGDTHGYMGKRQLSDIQAELAFMTFCYAHNVPVPELFVSADGAQYQTTPDGAYYAVMGYVEGEAPRNFTAGMTAQIATTMAAMHNLVSQKDFKFRPQRSWPGTVVDMTNERIAKFEATVWDLDDINREFIKQVIPKFKAQLKGAGLASLPAGVIHGDIMWENMKFQDGKLAGIFDFDDCRESFFVEDITKTLFFELESPEHSVFGLHGENVATFIQEYEKVRKLSESEKGVLPLLFTTRFLYQILGYNAKLAKGQNEYLPRIKALIARYREHQSLLG